MASRAIPAIAFLLTTTPFGDEALSRTEDWRRHDQWLEADAHAPVRDGGDRVRDGARWRPGGAESRRHARPSHTRRPGRAAAPPHSRSGLAAGALRGEVRGN